MDLCAATGLGIVLFASTNVDDIFVLLGFFSDRRFTTRQIVAGQYGGIGALTAVSMIGSLISLILAPAYVGLLGLLPILIGIHKLWELRSGGNSPEDEELRAAGKGWLGRAATVAAVTAANGGDNIGIYTPLFASSTGAEIAVICMVFVLMTAVWLFLAHFLLNHRTLGAPIRRYGHRIVPFVLIALGLFILIDAGSLRLVAK